MTECQTRCTLPGLEPLLLEGRVTRSAHQPLQLGGAVVRCRRLLGLAVLVLASEHCHGWARPEEKCNISVLFSIDRRAARLPFGSRPKALIAPLYCADAKRACCSASCRLGSYMARPNLCPRCDCLPMPTTPCSALLPRQITRMITRMTFETRDERVLSAFLPACRISASRDHESTPHTWAIDAAGGAGYHVGKGGFTCSSLSRRLTGLQSGLADPPCKVWRLRPRPT
jgi:hypothetical protein